MLDDTHQNSIFWLSLFANVSMFLCFYCLEILLLWSLSRSKILPQGFDTKSKKRYWGSMWDCPTILHSRISHVPPHKTLDGEAPILIGRRSLFPCSYKQWHFWNGDASSVRPILENRVSPNTHCPDDWLLGIGPKPCSMDWQINQSSTTSLHTSQVRIHWE